MTDKKKVRFTVNGIYPMVNKKETECCCGNCNEPFTKIVSLEVGDIIILIKLCDKHCDYINGMKEL